MQRLADSWRNSIGNETAIFPFMKTLTTINFKLLSTSRRAPLTGRPIDNTRHHSPAIHSTYVTTYYISKGFHSNPQPPRRYHCSINTIVCQCPSYTDIVGDPPEHCYCLIEQLGTMEDQGSNDVVIGVGQTARSGDLATKRMELRQDPEDGTGN